eukprot:gnl/TRDRNA2_/TRDRNA2_200473_c0_seq1.p1 gnl/TRDRNA2_/TRDRNA2_200473_c0~~gnl/TRDRNA2_/TRDRNA2_200473_c0_seq1.p1  ORF type:complete len:301 (+),score=72.62 gnl/TRDRNA2_/TRDRNA2_200473_c0_seq1:147-1049(+)
MQSDGDQSMDSEEGSSEDAVNSESVAKDVQETEDENEEVDEQDSEPEDPNGIARHKTWDWPTAEEEREAEIVKNEIEALMMKDIEEQEEIQAAILNGTLLPEHNETEGEEQLRAELENEKTAEMVFNDTQKEVEVWCKLSDNTMPEFATPLHEHEPVSKASHRLVPNQSVEIHLKVNMMHQLCVTEDLVSSWDDRQWICRDVKAPPDAGGYAINYVSDIIRGKKRMKLAAKWTYDFEPEPDLPPEDDVLAVLEPREEMDYFSLLGLLVSTLFVLGFLGLEKFRRFQNPSRRGTQNLLMHA